ncbi:TRAP transporter large permease [uncultured Thiothrix sp.]|uniref:TRAP transporter large permease n=1 Tax=uncultured Thiothrix sp. TaxID=223185 RepID=UPI00262612DA|nr:TRAP transporter large permease [uncultured Thiothrix sp.]HMT93094.1 TRAP transporter large permease [Thiolinea sp.]
MTIGVLAIIAVLILSFLRIPLGFSLLTVALVGIALLMDTSVALTLLPMTISEAVLSYELAVVPMFILMGNVISRTGISEELFKAANAFFGHVRGGLALSTMVACAGFSSVCGSSYATAATMSKVAYPSMRQYGYAEGLATATIAAGGTLGILIPPSIILVIYGILTQTNIGDLFIAGVVPGLLGLAMYMLTIYLISLHNPSAAPRGERTPWKERFYSLKGTWSFVAIFALIIGGLYMKWFSPTEAAGIGAGIAMLIAALSGKLSLKTLKTVLLETAYTSVTLYTVLFGALLFSKLISYSGLAEGILAYVQTLGVSGFSLILFILLVFLVLGCVMDSLAIILIFVPLFSPLIVAQGFDLVWFGIIVVVATEIALITPPIGMNVFVLRATLPNVPANTMFRGLTPFIAMDVVRLGILVAFPMIALWLVKMSG